MHSRPKFRWLLMGLALVSGSVFAGTTLVGTTYHIYDADTVIAPLPEPPSPGNYPVWNSEDYRGESYLPVPQGYNLDKGLSLLYTRWDGEGAVTYFQIEVSGDSLLADNVLDSVSIAVKELLSWQTGGRYVGRPLIIPGDTTGGDSIQLSELRDAALAMSAWGFYATYHDTTYGGSRYRILCLQTWIPFNGPCCLYVRNGCSAAIGISAQVGIRYGTGFDFGGMAHFQVDDTVCSWRSDNPFPYVISETVSTDSIIDNRLSNAMGSNSVRGSNNNGVQVYVPMGRKAGAGDSVFYSLVHFPLRTDNQNAYAVTSSILLTRYSSAELGGAYNYVVTRVLCPWFEGNNNGTARDDSNETSYQWRGRGVTVMDTTVTDSAWCIPKMTAQNYDTLNLPAIASMPNTFSFDISTLAAFWLANPDSNWGMLFKTIDDTVGIYRSFCSTENTTAGNRPVVTISYKIHD